jgi:hypothetical protein
MNSRIPDLGGIRQQQLAIEQAISNLKRNIAAVDRVSARHTGDLLLTQAFEQYRATLIGQLAVVLVQEELFKK